MITDPQKTDVSTNERGVWVSHSDDWTTMRIWRDESSALRDAVKMRGGVVRCRFGLDPRDVAREAQVAEAGEGL